MKITLIHPSRLRPEQAYATFSAWIAKYKGGLVDLEYILSVDSTDPTLNTYIALFNGWSVLVNDNRSCIDAVNNAAKESTGDVLIVMSDDFDCPHNWDALLYEHLDGKSDYIVKTKDGIQDWMITLPIMDRVYYNRFGYIYNPDYFHMFCDTEMTAVGDLLGKIIKLDLLFEHKHYTTGKVIKDAVNIRNDASWNQGEATYLRHLKDNFGLKTITGRISDTGHLEWARKKGIAV